MLNSVVFPDPFGPIRPAMLPRETSIEQSLSACTPPKALETPSVRSKAVMTRSWRSARPRSRPGPLPRAPRGARAAPRRGARRWLGGPRAGLFLAAGGRHPRRQQDDPHKKRRAGAALGQVRVGPLKGGVAGGGLEQPRTKEGPGGGADPA